MASIGRPTLFFPLMNWTIKVLFILYFSIVSWLNTSKWCSGGPPQEAVVLYVMSDRSQISSAIYLLRFKHLPRWQKQTRVWNSGRARSRGVRLSLLPPVGSTENWSQTCEQRLRCVRNRMTQHKNSQKSSGVQRNLKSNTIDIINHVINLF